MLIMTNELLDVLVLRAERMRDDHQGAGCDDRDTCGYLDDALTIIEAAETIRSSYKRVRETMEGYYTDPDDQNIILHRYRLGNALSPGCR